MDWRQQWTGPLAGSAAGLLSLATATAAVLPPTPTTARPIRPLSTSTPAAAILTPTVPAEAATAAPGSSSGSSRPSSTLSLLGATAAPPPSTSPAPPSTTPPDKTWRPPSEQAADQIACARSWETNTRDPRAYETDGTYDGAYQFLPSTWRRFAAQVEHLRASYGEHARWPENYAAMTANQVPPWVQDEVFYHGFHQSPGEWPSPNRYCRDAPYRPSGR